MSEHEWGKGPLFDPPHVRVEAEQQIKVERPADVELRQVMAPAVPGQHPVEQQAAHADPRLVMQVWHQLDAGGAPQNPLPASQTQSEAQTMAQLALAFYLLQELHVQGKPGFEHFIPGDGSRPDEDEPESDEPTDIPGRK
jgi:hypothetical protein